MPPDVGYADTSSDMDRPISRMNAAMIGQPIEMAIGPPLFHACPKVVKQPARMEMMENEMAKFEKPDQLRFSSCLYPSSASLRSSSLSWVRSATDSSFLRFDRVCAATDQRGRRSWCWVCRGQPCHCRVTAVARQIA